MKKAITLLMMALMVVGYTSCDKPAPEEEGEDEGTETPTPGPVENPGQNPGNTDTPEVPFYEEFPLECGYLLAEGSDVGVTIEVTKVEDRNFVFELRPGAMVQSFKLDVFPVAQLYNNLLNDKTFGNLESAESWAVNERIREYLFNESGSRGYAFSINDFGNDEDFLQIEFDWMNTSYAAASAIAIPDCGYVIAVVAGTDKEISSATQEDLTLCYVHTTSQPLVGDPKCEIEVNAGYRAFGVQHHLNSDAAGVYFFGYLTEEIDAYIDAFGDTMFRDFIRTRVTAPSYPNDPNNPESLYYSVNYGDAADHRIKSTTCAVAVDANLTPQEGYSRKDFSLLEMPDEEDQPESNAAFRFFEDKIAATYVEYQIDFDKECRTVYYLFYTEEQAQAVMNDYTDKQKRELARTIANTDGYGCHNPNFLWDAENQTATGSAGSVYKEDVLENVGFTPGETYRVVYTSRNGYGTLAPLAFSEPFTMDELNFSSPAGCKADVKLTLDNPTRTSFRSNIVFDPETVSVIHIQYMTEDFNPGFWTDASWEQWIDFIYHSEKYWNENNDYAPIVNMWPTNSSGVDRFVWTGMTPGTEYTVFMCVEDFDGNISEMYFDSISTEAIQVGPDPTVNMALVPSQNVPNDWTVTFDIDHDVEYYLYCLTKGTSDLALKIPGLTQSALNNIKDSGIPYETWVDGIYEWVAGGFENNGGGMRTEGNTSLDWQGNETVVAACIAVGRDDDGPVYKMYHLICKDGKAQTLEEIFGIE